MTKTVKNAVLVFTLLAAIFLVAFCIELIVVNRNTDNDDESVVSAGQTHEDGGEVDLQDYERGSANGDESDNGEFDDISGATMTVTVYLEGFDVPLPGYGPRFVMPMAGTDLTLVAYPDPDFFELFEGDYDWRFTYTRGGTASLEISFDFIQPLEGMAGLAERFLDGYLDGGESIVLGEGYIGNSSLRGYAVTGEREDNVTYEAWIHSLTGNPDAGMAVVFVMHFENEVQRAALHTIIDSMEMEDDNDSSSQ